MDPTAEVPEPIDVPVAGGLLRALRWGSGQRTIVAVHGITASAMAWQAVAAALPDGWSLVAPDLRGRGLSAALPGPYGLASHVADVLAVADQFGGARPVLTGHSLGAYIALLTAAANPQRFDRLVLVDGGLPLPVPSDADPDALLEATLGPALARLRQTFPSEQAYLDFWRAHPALANDWDAGIDQYVRYDLVGSPGAWRSRVSEAAVRTDGRELLTSGAQLGGALRGLGLPVSLLVAPAGMFGEPPGLLPAPLVRTWREQVAGLSVTLVPDTNHYTILFTDRAADAVADHLVG